MWKNGNQAKTYLAGAIERAPDNGKKWRADITPFLKYELNHDLFNPSLEESHVLTEEEFVNFRGWKETDLPKFRQTVHKILYTDLNMLLNNIDYIICNWDEATQAGGGTHGELTMAFWHKIPVYMVTQIPIMEISSWIVGCTTEIFADLDELKSFLREKYK